MAQSEFDSTSSPTQTPSKPPFTLQPSLTLTFSPSIFPSSKPSHTTHPSSTPSLHPTISMYPSVLPSSKPSYTTEPSFFPSIFPTISMKPSVPPSSLPTISMQPSIIPSSKPSYTSEPSFFPSIFPTISAQPSIPPSSKPSYTTEPSSIPSFFPTISMQPSIPPSSLPTISVQPSITPSLSTQPSLSHSLIPSFTMQPSSFPSSKPSITNLPSSLPSEIPSISKMPTASPSSTPTLLPTLSIYPSLIPSITPSSSPSSSPTTETYGFQNKIPPLQTIVDMLEFSNYTLYNVYNTSNDIRRHFYKKNFFNTEIQIFSDYSRNYLVVAFHAPKSDFDRVPWYFRNRDRVVDFGPAEKKIFNAGKVDAWFNLEAFRNDLYAEIKNIVRKVLLENPDLNIYFTGHGRAGAIATLLGSFMAATLKDLDITVLVTGCPKLAYDEFQWWVTRKRNLAIWRIVNKEDYIARLPEGVRSHVGHLLQLRPVGITAYYQQDGRCIKNFAGVPSSWYLGNSLEDHEFDQYQNYFANRQRLTPDTYYVTTLKNGCGAKKTPTPTITPSKAPSISISPSNILSFHPTTIPSTTPSSSPTRFDYSSPFQNKIPPMLVVGDMLEFSNYTSNDEKPSFIKSHFNVTTSSGTEIQVLSDSFRGYLVVAFHSEESDFNRVPFYLRNENRVDDFGPNDGKIFQAGKVDSTLNSEAFRNDLYNQLKPIVRDVINMNPSLRVFFTGHGKAGAIAILLGSFMAARQDELEITIISSGSPRIGYDDFQWWVTRKQNLAIWRIVNKQDYIARLPEGDRSHVGHLIQLRPIGASAYYQQRGYCKKDFIGVPENWYNGTSFEDHMFQEYEKYFVHKSRLEPDTYYVNNFETGCPPAPSSSPSAAPSVSLMPSESPAPSFVFSSQPSNSSSIISIDTSTDII